MSGRNRGQLSQGLSPGVCEGTEGRETPALTKPALQFWMGQWVRCPEIHVQRGGGRER